MTPSLFVAIAVSEVCSIVGQLLFKLAMNETNASPGRGTKFIRLLASGIAVMALGFFLWLGLMSKFDLSYLYPFEGLSRIILVFAACFFLKEKMTFSLFLGVLMISAGILLVSTS